jgi:hypothetical protein
VSIELRPGGLLPGIPADLDGRVRLALDEFALRDRAVTALKGLIEVRDVRSGRTTACCRSAATS